MSRPGDTILLEIFDPDYHREVGLLLHLEAERLHVTVIHGGISWYCPNQSQKEMKSNSHSLNQGCRSHMDVSVTQTSRDARKLYITFVYYLKLGLIQDSFMFSYFIPVFKMYCYFFFVENCLALLLHVCAIVYFWIVLYTHFQPTFLKKRLNSAILFNCPQFSQILFHPTRILPLVFVFFF